jgi:LacI family transcriptional regulator
VSLATVDRVVNRREGVRERTIARVEAAVVKLGYRADSAATRLARNQSFRFAFILPTGANTFMSNLAEQVRRTADWLAGQRGFIDTLHVDVFDPDALAGALETIPPSYHGVATVALDHPRVRAAIDDLAARGVAVVTLVSDAPSSRRLHYVGIDNPAAGRTAATLIGRFLHGRKGTVGVIAGSLALRDHAERQFGFHQILSGEYPDLTMLAAVEGRDDSARTRTLTATLLAQRPDLIGIYSVGAGNRGIAAALEDSRRAREIVWIAHELTVHTRGFLLRGVIDAIINQDPGHEARSAARVLLAHCSGEPISPDQERIRIDIFLRDNLP